MAGIRLAQLSEHFRAKRIVRALPNAAAEVTGLSGSGPAFPALLAAVMIEDAVAHGISRDIARRSATATLVGAGHLFEQIGEEPAEIVGRFVGYGGTTAAAIAAMRSRGFDAAVSAGLASALKKSVGFGHGS